MLQQTIRVAGSKRVSAVYRAEYHKAPVPLEKSGAQAPNPGLYLYGAIVKKGGTHNAKDTVHPAPKPNNI